MVELKLWNDGGHHCPQRSGETAGVSGPVRTGAGGMAHGDGTGGAGECEAGEASSLTFLRKRGEEIPEE